MCLHSVWMSNNSIRPISGATTPGQNGPGSDGNEGVFHIPQSSCITGASPSDSLESYPRHSLRGQFYLSAEMRSVYFISPADLAAVARGRIIGFIPLARALVQCEMQTTLSRIELGSSCPFPTTITIIQRICEFHSPSLKNLLLYGWHEVGLKLDIRGSLNTFPDFFRMGTFIDSTHMKL